MAEPQTSTQTAGETADDIGSIMSGQSGSEQPATQPAESGGKGQGQSAPDDGNGSKTPPAWMSQIGDITKNKDAADKLSKFAKLSDLANAYMELDGKLGNSIVKPGENASDEEREAFYRALGKPESADKYSIEGDEAKLFREMAYKNNLTDEQAKALYASLKEAGKNALAQHKAAYEQQAKETQNALQAEYGNEYPKKIEMLKRGVKAYCGESVAAKLQQAGLLADKEIVKMFILLGEESSEAGSPGNGRTKADGYKSIQDGGFLSFGDDFKDK